jgi:putative DNA primase/helicase
VLDGGLGDDGLMQRFQLLVWPDVTGEWKNVDRWPDSDAKQTAYEVFARLSVLNPADLRATSSEDGGVPYLNFRADAQQTFTEWRSELEHRVRRADEPAALEAHLSKYRSLIPSLALLIHLADHGENPVGLDAMERACAWAEYLESHARRVYCPMLARDYIAARALAAHILKGDLPNPFALRDVYRVHWADLATRDDAEKAVDVLVDLDWLREQREETGGRPRERYDINPRVKEIES